MFSFPPQDKFYFAILSAAIRTDTDLFVNEAGEFKTNGHRFETTSDGRCLHGCKLNLLSWLRWLWDARRLRRRRRYWRRWARHSESSGRRRTAWIPRQAW